MRKSNRSRSPVKSLSEKRVRDASGRIKVVRTLDANSSSFSADLEIVFQRNIDRARLENKRTVGANDFVRPRKK